MRNLKSVRFTEVPLQPELPLTAAAWDTVSDSVICAFGPAVGNPIIDLRRKRQDARFNYPAGPQDLELIASWDVPCPLPDLACDRVLSLQYFADNMTVILVLEGGDITIVREDPQPGEDKIEILGSVDVGITAAAWSPDEELLALTTRANTFLYMTREFENVAELTFTSEDLKLSRHVSVGWGKKETQFQGKRAKALRDPTMPEKVDEGRLSSYDDSRTTISWRGDGAFVAVNSIETGIRRVIRVYSREGSLDSVSEPVDGLEEPLSWRPAGNLIAGIQRLDDRIDVIFFERNGLRHGQFALRLSETERLSWASNICLEWNIDSTVLAVCFQDRIQLWTMGNYHYYLKQEIPMTVLPKSTLAFSFRWHQEKSLRFLAASSCSIIDADWVFNVTHGSTASPEDFGAVAVIDGRILKLTPLRLAGVSPPMAHCEITLDSNIVDACFSRTGARIAVLTSNSFSVFAWYLQRRPVPIPLLESSYAMPVQSRPRQIAFLNDNEVYLLNHYDPYQCQIEKTALETRETKVIYEAGKTGHLHRLFPSLGHEKLWLSQFIHSGVPASYYAAVSNFEDEFVLYENSPSADTLWAEAVQLSDDQDVLVTISRSGALYANKRLLAKNCTSFMTTPSHIIFTTTQHLLKFVHITNVEDMEVPADKPETDERCRSIERGGRLVTVMPSKFTVSLQMPRGNLETIYPRALVLAGIRTFINKKDYRSAYLACRSQIVDMNILHDYAPDQFMENIPLFIEQVKRVDFIDEFLSRLKEEDVSRTLYKDTLKLSKIEVEAAATSPRVFTGINRGSKVNRICDAFLEALKNKMDTNLQNLVTANVCKSPPDLDAGLQLVACLREKNHEQAEEAIGHMCFLADANHLFNDALGLYDLELTLLVAQQAQRDPREYLPFLRKLQQLPDLRRHFEIDNHLGRFAKALKHLHALGVFDELKEYTIKHSLYKECLELYKYRPEPLREITNLYADYLYDQNNYLEAAIAYESLALYEPACKSYQLAHRWRESLFCALMLPMSETEFKAYAVNLATTLTEESKDYVSAAHIYAEHLKDAPTAARLFCKGLRFADAARLLALNGQQSLIADIVDTGLADAMGSTTDFLADCKVQLLAQLPRFRELREKREADPLAYYGGDPSNDVDGADIPDNVSLAPTDASMAASMFTRYTGGTSVSRRTSKTRRREERKRARGKKGTVYEEEYLVNSVRRLIERMNSTLEEVQALVEALLRHGMRERAVAVEKALQEILVMCSGCLGEVFEEGAQLQKGVWKADATAAGDSQGVDENRHLGGDAVLWETIQAREHRTAPVVREYKKLALLG